MTTHPVLTPTSGAHVDAYRSSGSSPGRSGRSRIALTGTYGTPFDEDLAWEVHGPAHRAPVVVLGGISATRHLSPTALDPTPGWWPGIVREGGVIDPTRRRLVGVDYLGEADGPVSTHDQAQALSTVLDEIGAREVTLVGASYGGMVALAFAALHPARVERVVVVGAAHRTHPLATALRSVQRAVVDLGRATGRDAEALSLARGLAMITYRSAEEFEARFGVEAHLESGRARFPVEEYLRARGLAFAERFGAERFLRLSESIDLHDVDLSTVTAPTTLVSFDTDALVPPWLVEEAVRTLGRRSTHVRLRSIYGHDAFLKEVGALDGVLRLALDGTSVAAPAGEVLR